MTQFKFFWAILVVGLLSAAPLASCGNSDDDDDGDDDTSDLDADDDDDDNGEVDAEAECMTIRKAQCDYFGRCFLDYFPIFFCEDKNEEAWLEQCVAGLEAQLDRGYVTFNWDKLDEASDYLKNADCDTKIFQEVDKILDDLATGTLENGAACIGDDECASGYCEMEPFVSQCGVCKDKLTSDGDCSYEAECDEGLYCGEYEDEKICMPIKNEGEDCDQSQECALGYVCIGGSCVTSDGTCDTFDDCPLGLICKGMTNETPEDGGASTCEEPAQLGEDCEGLFDCDIYQGLICQPETSRCAEYPRAEEGEACGSAAAEGEPNNCVSGLECIEEVCRTRKAVGESCEIDEECLDHTYACQEGVCVALMPPESCH